MNVLNAVKCLDLLLKENLYIISTLKADISIWLLKLTLDQQTFSIACGQITGLAPLFWSGCFCAGDINLQPDSAYAHPMDDHPYQSGWLGAFKKIIDHAYSNHCCFSMAQSPFLQVL